MNINRLWIYLLAGILVLNSCNDDDDQPVLEYQSQGQISGTITGSLSDDVTTLNESFKYNQYAPGLSAEFYLSYYRTYDDGDIDLRIIRQDIKNGGFAAITLEMDAADLNKPVSGFCQILYNADKGNSVITFSSSSSLGGSNGNSFTITDFSFDKVTGQTKGKYELKGATNSTDNQATVTGEFDVVLKQIVQ